MEGPAVRSLEKAFIRTLKKCCAGRFCSNKCLTKRDWERLVEVQSRTTSATKPRLIPSLYYRYQMRKVVIPSLSSYSRLSRMGLLLLRLLKRKQRQSLKTSRDIFPVSHLHLRFNLRGLGVSLAFFLLSEQEPLHDMEFGTSAMKDLSKY